MASHTKKTDAKGEVFYKVQVSDGRGRKVTRNWRPEPGWSAWTIQSKLDQFAANLKNELAAGTVKTKHESDEEKRLAELEAAKLKTLRQYADGVFMPAKETTFSENARYSYRMFLDKHIFPTLGGPSQRHFNSYAQEALVGLPEKGICPLIMCQALQYFEQGKSI